MRAQAEGLKYLSMIPRLCIREISLQSQYGHALPENPLGATCENPFVATAAPPFSRNHNYCMLYWYWLLALRIGSASSHLITLCLSGYGVHSGRFLAQRANECQFDVG